LNFIIIIRHLGVI